MILSDSGIVLRTRLFTESSLIVHWLSQSHGRLSTVAKGARRPKSAFAGKLDLFYSADFSFVRSRRSDLHTLREVRLVETRPWLRLSLPFLQQAAYMAALVEQTTESDSPLPEVFFLVKEFLRALPSNPPHPEMILAFELKLLSVLGLAPDTSEIGMTSAALELMRKLMAEDWPTAAPLDEAEDACLVLRKYLHGFLIYNFGKLARGRDSALQPG